MANIEVLGYCLLSSKTMAEFIDFCINGTEGDPTEPGVFEWLYSRPVTQAHFFTSSANDSMGVFGATVLRPEPQPVPWMDQIKGFEKFVTVDGELDQTDHFQQLTATVTPNHFMDDKFVQSAGPVMEVLAALKATDRSGFSFTAPQFAAALRGDVKVDRVGILSEIEKRLGKPLFEKTDLAAIRKSLGIDS
jgi:hypothetical protein